MCKEKEIINAKYGKNVNTALVEQFIRYRTRIENMMIFTTIIDCAHKVEREMLKGRVGISAEGLDMKGMSPCRNIGRWIENCNIQLLREHDTCKQINQEFYSQTDSMRDFDEAEFISSLGGSYKYLDDASIVDACKYYIDAEPKAFTYYDYTSAERAFYMNLSAILHNCMTNNYRAGNQPEMSIERILTEVYSRLNDDGLTLAGRALHYFPYATFAVEAI